MAFPHKPIIKTEAPNFVKRPNPFNARGHIPAQTNELANPNSTTNQIEIWVSNPNKDTLPFTNKINNENDNPMIVHILRTFNWEMYFGINKIPRK